MLTHPKKKGQATLITTSLQSSNEQKSEIIMARVPYGRLGKRDLSYINREKSSLFPLASVYI
jgi:hypothetical protein